jgi:hypothetical protein
MDPLDHVPAGRDGTNCAACDGSVPVAATRTLARREGLAVLQVACPDCGSVTLDFQVDGASGRHPAHITGDDVLDMHALLQAWHGNLADLLGSTEADPA